MQLHALESVVKVIRGGNYKIYTKTPSLKSIVDTNKLALKVAV